MFRPSPEPLAPEPLLDSLPGGLRRRLEKSWPLAFRLHILPLIPDDLFTDDFHPEHGAPNKPHRCLLAFLLLQHFFDLTDEQALDSLYFDFRWHLALGLQPGQLYFCQKTLHNYRALLRQHDRARSFFEQVTARLRDLLGLRPDLQRLDSTHIKSCLADLSRLAICCETIRLFLRHLRRHPLAEPDAPAVPLPLARRYFCDDDQPSHFEYTDKPKTQRRLHVAGRDLWRLVQLFGSHQELAQQPPLLLLRRALQEQFDPTEQPVVPLPEDADAGEPAAPVSVRPPRQVPSDSLQSPHDPDAGYGRKGKGYEVQVCETFGNKSEQGPCKPELITYVAVTPSWQCDVQTTLVALDDLDRRGMRPCRMEVDANFTSSEVVLQARADGTVVNGPVKGNAALPGPLEVTLGDFVVDEQDGSRSRCPAGHRPVEQVVQEAQAATAAEGSKPAGQGEGKRESATVVLSFLLAGCLSCPQAKSCPVPTEGKEKAGGRIELRTTRGQLCASQRRRYQTTEEFAQRQANRAGIEATNSELKRRHGLGELRVRGRERVEQSVYLKATACNVKRVANYLARLSPCQRAKHPPPSLPLAARINLTSPPSTDAI